MDKIPYDQIWYKIDGRMQMMTLRDLCSDLIEEIHSVIKYRKLTKFYLPLTHNDLNEIHEIRVFARQKEFTKADLLNFTDSHLAPWAFNDGEFVIIPNKEVMECQE